MVTQAKSDTFIDILYFIKPFLYYLILKKLGLYKFLLSILQIRKLRPEGLSHLPEVTQQTSSRAGTLTELCLILILNNYMSSCLQDDETTMYKK